MVKKNVLNKKLTITMRDSSGRPMTKRSLLLWALNVPNINVFKPVDSQEIKTILQKLEKSRPSGYFDLH